MRLQTYVKNNGNFTKSETIKLQNENRILVNGNKVNLSYNLRINDIVTIDDVEIKNIPFVYFLFNKPKGIICTNDINVKNNIKTLINSDIRIYTVGRLDKESHGLIILTNDNMFCHDILDVDNHMEKEYIVRVEKKIDQLFINNIQKSIYIKDKKIKESIAYLVDDYSFRIILKEGKYHQIREMVKYNNNKVVDLTRIRIGSLKLEDFNLKENEIIEIKNMKELIRG